MQIMDGLLHNTLLVLQTIMILHEHVDNMEIITIPLSGDLEHKDSMGNSGVIKQGEIQVMSAGTGIQHSEFNKSSDKELKLLQIWVFPNKKNVEPRYDQISLLDIEKQNDLYQIVSPNKDEKGVWIHQNAWFHIGNLKKGLNKNYMLKDNNNGVYVFLIEGVVSVENQQLNKRDGMAISETENFNIEVMEDSHILLMEIPMLMK